MIRLFLLVIPFVLGQTVFAASLDCTTAQDDVPVLVSNVSLEFNDNVSLIHFKLPDHQNPMSVPLMNSKVEQGALTIAEDIANALAIQFVVWLGDGKAYISASPYVGTNIPQTLVCR